MKTLDLVSIRKWFFLFSGIVILASLVTLAIPPALKPGIEFTSGTTMLLAFNSPVDQAELRNEFANLGHPEARIQSTDANEFLIRTSTLEVPAGSFTEVEPTATPTATATPAPGGPTVRLGEEGGSGDFVLRAVVGGDPCQLGIDAGTVPVGSEATIIQRFDDCPDGPVYRVQVGTITGYVRASDTYGLTGTPTPAPTALPEGTPDPAATPETGETPVAGAPATPEATPRPPQPGERGEIERALQERFGGFEVREFSSVSPVVSAAAVRNATIAVVIASVFILAYIAFAFSSVPRPFRYGACAIAATVHDVIVVLGAFSLFGKFFDVEVNLMFITGLLTVIGYSVHDTIVVFDRIRENVRLAPNAPLEENVNAALVQTLGRSLNTSITVLLAVLALLLLGGVTIQSFLLVLLVGIVAGVYSSVGIAAQLLVAWEYGDFGRILDRLRGRRREAAPS